MTFGEPRRAVPQPRRQFSGSREVGSIRPVYAGVFDLDPAGYPHAKDVVLSWLRAHSSLRAHTAEIQAVPLDFNRLVDSGLLAQIQVDDSDHTTVVRLQHRHVDPVLQRPDPARNWRTDVTLERDDVGAWIATRQWYLGFAGDSLRPSVPNFIRILWNKGALSDLDILEPNVRVLEHPVEVDGLVSLILDEQRALPVVVLADGCPLDANRVATDSIGLAHVFKLSRESRFALLAAMRSLELQHGALQTFSPKAEGRPPFIRAARFETIITWRYGDRVGPAAFAAWLHDELARMDVLQLLNDPAHRTIESVKTEALQAKRTSLESQQQDVANLTEQLELSNLELELLQTELKGTSQLLAELTERAAQLSSGREAAEQSLRDERERNHRLQQDKAALQFALSAKRGEDELKLNADQIDNLIEQQPTPDNIFDALEQAERIFALYGLRVRVSETAKESAMDALSFKRPGQVQDALLRLGFFWSDIRASGQRLDQEATRVLRFPTSMHESETTMRLYGGQRGARIDDQMVQLQKHIKLGGGGKGESARIYFGDRDGELLIGHVGHHLDVASTQ